MIPARLHRVIPAVVPDRYADFWSSWCDLHPQWEHRTHQDPLDPDEWPLTAHAWRFCSSGAQLAGLVRLEAVWREGGVFLDWDVRPVGRSLAPLRGVLGGAFAAWEDERHIPDAVFGSEAGHPVVLECMTRAIAACAAGEGPWAAAVGVFTSTWQNRGDVTLLPRESFFPVSYEDRPGARAFQPVDGDGVFGVHEWRWSWNPAHPEPDLASWVIPTDPA